MEFTRELVRSEAADYRAENPFYPVEQEQLETLPRAFETAAFGWRDAAWVVRWYYRRFLGSSLDAERRAAEERFQENDLDAIRAAIADAVDAITVPERDAAVAIDALTALDGVDVPVATAFLTFLAPQHFTVLGPREWAVLHDAGELAEPYPTAPTASDYETYLDRCRSIATTTDCELRTVRRALWRLSDTTTDQ
ncbi:hypothetical protein [Natrialba asiatica]|uniref:DNA-3-methyladenine glycosylase 2 family protein n=1 Tax=Natrialba asiatica (strain ATCC 700177 / DSM 12278 / JCM 9576 / FERM P-10747 / NBRC 102637 / 172P1) TaxID=29540 RepID=M0ANH8_NATA1|nr:hypothetical protein [Natrialba asiatica]ELZ00060.1 hypothetical protein C481_13729 [Natrialba asiatica DSM 12278]